MIPTFMQQIRSVFAGREGNIELHNYLSSKQSNFKISKVPADAAVRPSGKGDKSVFVSDHDWLGVPALRYELLAVNVYGLI